MVVASRGLTIDDSDYGEGIVDRDREPPTANTEEQLVRATSRHGSFIHSTTTSERTTPNSSTSTSTNADDDDDDCETAAAASSRHP